VLNLSHNWFIFHSIFILVGGGGGQAGGEIWSCIEFKSARLPTLQIWVEKKVAKIPEQTHPTFSIYHKKCVLSKKDEMVPKNEEYKMQSTLTLDNDIAVRLKRLNNLRNESFTQTLNEVIAAGMNLIESKSVHQDKPYRIKPVHLGAKLPNLDNVAEIIAATEGELYK